MSKDRPIGIGVVGTGGWARGFWDGARESPDVKLVACWNRTPERAEKFVGMYGGEIAPSLEALIANPEVDAIANFASNNYHCEPTRLAAAAGKHVFVDKPIANTCEEAAEMIEVCDRAGVTLMVGHSSRYHGASRLIKQHLVSGSLGDLALVEGNNSHSGGTRLSADSWRWHWEEAPGGPLMQLSIHLYDTLHYLFGPTRRVTAFSKRDLLPSEIEDVFLTLLEFESGLLAYVGTNYVAPPINYLRVFGRGGNLYSEHGKVVHVWPKDAWTTDSAELEVPKVNAHAAEMSELARAIRTGTPPETDGRGGLLALGVVWAAVQSAQQNRPVEVREALGETARLLG